MLKLFNFPLAPEQASNFAQEYDNIFYALTILTIIFTVLVGALVLFFVIRYREGSKVDRSRPIYEHLPLELAMTTVPTVLGLVVFFFGANLFVKMRTPPENAMDIYIVGKQWMWHAQHAPSGVRENNTLHVPINKPVRLTMISQDVIHAFFIPEFRIQYRVVPGRYTTQWFTATKPGVYHLFCNMYCGGQHSEMGGYVYAMEPKEYAQWLANGGNDLQAKTMEQRGAIQYDRLACANCHEVKDTARAPSLYGFFGRTRKFTNGTSAVADDAYFRKSLIDPHELINEGYENTMSAYNDVGEEEILNLAAYVRSLGTSAEPKAGSPSIEAKKGDEYTGNSYQGKPNLSVGALAHENKPTTPGPSRGNLSTGAISTEGGAKR
ncbi:MAG: cytochrome c oxidase subunit II [Chlorobia bacterium]|nr:cytochrome c oxidase subunit II [Fimbriimonadaceae bacterium]